MALMSRHFKIAPPRLLDPTEEATMPAAIEGLVSQVANRSGFTSVLGLGLRRLGTFGDNGPGLLKLSMLPQGSTLKRNRQLGVVSRTLYAAWAIIFVIMTAWTGGAVMPDFLSSKAESGIYDAIKAEATASQARIGQIRETVKVLDGQLQKMETLSHQRGRAIIIESIPDLVPDGVELSAYYVSHESELRIQGAARSPDALQLFASELQNSGLVDPPSVGQPAYREGSPIFDFEIITTLRQES